MRAVNRHPFARFFASATPSTDTWHHEHPKWQHSLPSNALWSWFSSPCVFVRASDQHWHSISGLMLKPMPAGTICSGRALVRVLHLPAGKSDRSPKELRTKISDG